VAQPNFGPHKSGVNYNQAQAIASMTRVFYAAGGAFVKGIIGGLGDYWNFVGMEIGYGDCCCASHGALL
jgi:hypothetical protein